VGKNLTFGGIINDVQHRIAKNGKGWGIFTLEGYDESYEFKIFERNTLSSYFYSKQFYLYESIGQRGLGQSGYW
jgi:DNA polymerase-3 subunit alpha